MQGEEEYVPAPNKRYCELIFLNNSVFHFYFVQSKHQRNERNKGKYLNQEKNVKHKVTFYYLLSLKGILSFNFLNRFRIFFHRL